MELKNLQKKDLIELAKKVNRNPEHLRKIAIGERPCPAKVAQEIDKATGGLVKKEQLVGWE